jgi:hypothetical protein
VSQEETRASVSPEEGGSEAQEATEQEQTQERDEQPSQEEETSASREEAADEMVPKSELNKKNKEAENLRRRLRQFERQEEEKRKEQLSETEALQEENGTLKQQLEGLQGQVRRANFERQLDLPDADLAWGMLADLGLEVEWGENNTPTNIDGIRTALKKRKPRVWGAGSANGGERGETPAPSGSGVVDAIFRAGRSGTARR